MVTMPRRFLDRFFDAGLARRSVGPGGPVIDSGLVAPGFLDHHQGLGL
jgi:hypothetical protein